MDPRKKTQGSVNVAIKSLFLRLPLPAHTVRLLFTGIIASSAMSESEFLEIPVTCFKRGKNRVYKMGMVSVLLLFG